MKFNGIFAKPEANAPVGGSIGEYGIVSYSQEGEDLVLRRFLKDETKGFYVDVGAHHPQRFSNTYYFYQKGWRGINVDADPDLVKEFDARRPRDINITAGVGSDGRELTFYVFNEKALNTFDQEIARKHSKIMDYSIVEERTIKIVTLSKILDKHLPNKQRIDFMSVDVEGNDLDVLKSNNWDIYRPRFLLVECHNISSIPAIMKDKLVTYLFRQRYIPVAKTLLTVIFTDTDLYES